MAFSIIDFLVKPGSKVNLDDYDADFKFDNREKIENLTKQNISRANELQEILYAEGKHKVLVALQARDAGGKDSTIRRVFGPLNPQGVKVYGFKVPSQEELAHDYLWRIHAKVPKKGEIVIFNRSHYEDIIAVGVKGLAPRSVVQKRYRHINDFERMLVDEGTTVMKFYLNISKDEQKQRFQDRLDDPTKHWKFRIGDLDDRKLWEKYTEVYETVMERTSKNNALWHIVPSNKKWVRDYVVSSIFVDALERLDMKYPEPEEGIGDIVIE